MYSEKVTVKNSSGLHARPAALFIKTASQFKSKITLIHAEKEISAKSILSLLSLGITEGAEITINAQGDDEILAVTTLTQLVLSKFGE